MKRFAVSILACIYFVASSGMLLRQHYCMGDLIETQIDFGQIAHTATCGDCGMEEAEGSCCESKMKLVKKVDDQQQSAYQGMPFMESLATLMPVFQFAHPKHSTPVQQLTASRLQKPPPKSLPVFLEIRNLRI